MRAIRIHAFGGPGVLSLDEAEAPVPGRGEVLVDVHAASVNPGDIKVRTGAARYLFDPVLPHIPGRDFSGVVRQVAEGVGDFRAGDEVFGVTATGKEGAYAEMIAIDGALIAPKPRSISHSEAAAAALTGLTALTCLEDAARLKAGETVLVHGGAGGVGGFAVQYAKSMGARVIATARAVNHAYLRRIGADQVIDYTTQDFVKVSPRCDVVLDLVGGEVFRRSLAVLRPGGRLVRVSAGKPAPDDATRADVAVMHPVVVRDRAHLERVARLLEQGAVSAPEIIAFPLEHARQAHERLESSNHRGKVVLTLR